MSLGGGSGGGSTTTSIDKTYNAGMLALSQEQQDWAREMFGAFTEGVGGGTSELQYMQNVINANQSLLGGQTELELSQMGLSQDQIAAMRSLLPGQTELERSRMGFETAQIGSGMELLPGQTALSKSQMGIAEADIAARHELLPGQTALSKLQASDTMAGIQERAPVRSKFFSEALEGVDANERMNLAQADVAQSFAGAEGTARRSAARMGRSAGSIDFSKMATERAKGIGLARTTARTGAKDESFRRLQSAMGL
jgi:hypothetical protein